MGTKYASLHIKAGSSENIIEQLKKYYNDNSNREVIISDRYPDYFKEILADKLIVVRDLLDSARKSSRIILIKDEFISIYDEAFSLETIEQEGINLSKYIDNPILATGNLDDDVFSVVLIKNGNIITKHTVGDGLDCYDIEPSHLDLNKFENIIKLRLDKEKVNDLLIEDDVTIVEEGFCELLKIFLNLDCNDIKSNKEYFKKVSKSNNYTIYKFSLEN
ncbi:MAG TPA: hypothetical protein DHW61_17310 [Lachnoclostridium phytofermentans]|uniref:Uncharacterized protein n=1 Tax=Lachnoclostridium phytofermentans TaxID=66219 RepID=A0A3D2XAH9_9FIRM|nr:hypothetical protein [Lachnoclostridium sp.]HCL04139.1 hypothetical protein [Lachnoclostridium phytofermentans]